MGILSSILRFIFPRQFREELSEEISEVKPEEEIPGLSRRKIAKTGKSKEGNRNLFAYTFERNTTDRFQELKGAIEEEYEIELSDDDLGYDDFTNVARPPFEFPEIRTGKE